MGDTIDLIQPLTDVSFKAKVLIYGPPGAGKTIFSASGPNTLYLDADGTGALSILNFPELASKVRVLQVREFNQMLDVLDALRANDPRFADIETVVIDTLSELQKRHLDEVVAREKAMNPNRAAIPFQQDYKTNTEGMRRLVIWFRDIDKNLICVAHETEEKDEGTQILTHRPLLTPRLASTMEGIFDLFGYMSAEIDDQFDVTRQLQVMPSRRVKAKTRIGGLPPIIKDPTFQMILDAKAEMIRRNNEYREQHKQEPATPAVPAASVSPFQTIQGQADQSATAPEPQGEPNAV